MITAGTPNLEIQVEIRARAQDSAEMEDKGTASGHLVVHGEKICKTMA